MEYAQNTNAPNLLLIAMAGMQKAKSVAQCVSFISNGMDQNVLAVMLL